MSNKKEFNKINQYLDEEMSASNKTLFEKEIAENETLATEVASYRRIKAELTKKAEIYTKVRIAREALEADGKLSLEAQSTNASQNVAKRRPTILRSLTFRQFAAAASVLLLISAGWWFFMQIELLEEGKTVLSDILPVFYLTTDSRKLKKFTKHWLVRKNTRAR